MSQKKDLDRLIRGVFVTTLFVFPFSQQNSNWTKGAGPVSGLSFIPVYILNVGLLLAYISIDQMYLDPLDFKTVLKLCRYPCIFIHTQVNTYTCILYYFECHGLQLLTKQ